MPTEKHEKCNYKTVSSGAGDSLPLCTSTKSCLYFFAAQWDCYLNFFLVWLSTSYGCSSLLLKKVYRLNFRVFFILNLFCILFFSWGIPKLNLILIRIWRKFEIRVVKYSNKKCALFFWYLCILVWIFKKLSVLSCKWNSRE